MPYPSTTIYPSESLYPGSSFQPPPGPARRGAPTKATQIPKLRIPLEMGSRSLRVVEQDSLDEVAQCCYAVLATPLGSRLEEPAFGIEDPTFEQIPVETAEWVQALDDWEPRAEVRTEQDVVELVDTVRVRMAVA